MSERFDDLARAVAESEEMGRRRLLRRALAAVGIGAGAVLLGERPAIAGKPATSCPPGLSSCDGLCRDTSSHPNHCGACGHTCSNDSVCRNGTCVKVTCDCGPSGCPTGKTLCNGVCVDTQSDAANCGSCYTACPSGSTCQSGTCVSNPGCPAGQADCGNGVCVDISSNVSNCGACGNVCSSANGTAVCQNGTCVMGACNAGFADCDGNPATGCETNVMSSISNCGGCGVTCPPGGTCQGGVCSCVPATCPQVGADCGIIADGCGGSRNCGTCPGGMVCSNNHCVPA